MKSKKISSYYSKLRKMDKDYRDNGHFVDYGNALFTRLLVRYMGYKKPFKDYDLAWIPDAEVYTCAETGDWSGLLSFIKEEETLSDVLKEIPKLEITDKILKQMENKIDLLMDYIDVKELTMQPPADEFLESIV